MDYVLGVQVGEAFEELVHELADYCHFEATLRFL